MGDLLIWIYTIILTLNAGFLIANWKSIEERYKLFSTYILVSFFFTVFQLFIIKIQTFYPNTIASPMYRALIHGSSNVFVLLEAFLLVAFVWKAGYLKQYPKILHLLLLSIFIFWLINGIYAKYGTEPMLYYRVFYSTLLVLFTIHAMNHEIVQYKNNLLKYPLFLIFVAIIILFTYLIVLESFYLFGKANPSIFLMRIFRLLNVSIYSIAIIWMLRRD